MISDIEKARLLYAPNLGTQTDNLPHMADSLRDACLALAADCTLPRIDQLVSRLKTAEQSLTRLRLAMIDSEIERHGTGVRTYQQEQMK